MLFWLTLLGCAFQPTFGAWTYSPTTVDVDSCGLGEYLDAAPAQVTLEQVEAGVRLTDAEGHSFDCTLEDQAFTCPDRWPERVVLNNTELEADGEAHGAFDSITVARGSQSVTLDCIDVSCEIGAAALGMDPPCDLAVSFVLTKNEG